MPHLPDSAHDTHDLELVAALAAGDAIGADRESAMALVATCTECAALQDDLRSIMAAMPAMPAPTRPRDFRLSPDQASSLRPRGWRAVVAALGSPRFAFAAPLGTGLAALGIVGVLVASGGLPAGGGTAAESSDQSAAGAQAAPEYLTLGDASAAPTAPSGDQDLALKAAPGPTAATGTEATREAVGTVASPEPLFIAGVLLVVIGLVLVATRLLARQAARAP